MNVEMIKKRLLRRLAMTNKRTFAMTGYIELVMEYKSKINQSSIKNLQIKNQSIQKSKIPKSPNPSITLDKPSLSTLCRSLFLMCNNKFLMVNHNNSLQNKSDVNLNSILHQPKL